MLAGIDKPPTLSDYLELGITLSQLSESERESIQFMLDKLNLNLRTKNKMRVNAKKFMKKNEKEENIKS